jgi:hypothetical protein
MKVAFAGTFAVLDVWYRYPTGPAPGASPH